MGDETRLSEVLAFVLERRERGEPVDAERVIREHPEIADDLRVHFAAAQFVDVALAGMAPAPAAAKVPERLGAFRIERELGSGGMGTVYAATAEADVPGVARGERIALKVVHPHLLRRPGYFRRFVREAELGARVRHANVVRTLFVDAVVEDGTPCHFLAMEHVEGETLRQLLAEVGRVPEELCRHVAREVAKGLAAIHAAGVVHRDLKPENVLITKDHAVKVMDLGVAQLQDEAIRLSQTGAFVGSLHYAAPEQVEDRGHVDGRADLHALGLLLYELATGLHPYGDDSDARAMLRKVLEETPRRCAEINPQLSPFFEEVVHTLLAKKREERFPAAPDLLLVLEEGERSEWWKDRSMAIRAATRKPLRRIRIPRETAVYGREAELDRLRALWERARSGEGGVLLVEGEAGIGKSRLVDEFAGRLQAAGEDLNFLFGSYPPGGAATASGAFSTAYREQFGEEGCVRYLPQTPLLVAAFDALLRGDAAPTGSEPLTKDSLQTVFVHATRSLAAERPTIVLVEDLHFAPEEGRALFASLALAVPGHRVLLVATTRPGLPEQWRSQLERPGHAQRMELPRLGAKDLVLLLRDAFRSERLAEELGARIALKSDGNPFFVFEILRGLREGQFLRQRPDGTWETTQVLQELTVPSSILDLVKARVAGLEDEERDLLDVAACRGYEFDATLVADALGLARIPTLKRFAQIERRHRLVRAAGQRFVFDHHQVQEALRGTLPEQLAQEYHAAIADALERRSGAAEKEPKDLDGALCVDLAEHLLGGAQGPRALRYVDAALTHLETGYLNDQAVALADRALAVPGLLAGRERIEVLLRLAARLDRIGRRDAERAAVDEALSLTDAVQDDGLRARARNALGRLLLGCARSVDAESAYRVALVLAQSAGDRTAETRATSGLGNVLIVSDRTDEAFAQYERQLALARGIGDRREEAVATGNLGNVLSRLGRFAETLDRHERELALAQEIGDREVEARARGSLGNVLLILGRCAEARAHTERCLALAHEVGDRRLESNATCNLGRIHYSLDCTADARASYERGLALDRELGNRRGQAICLVNLGRLRIDLGDCAAARRDLEDALGLFRELGDLYPAGYAHWGLAELASEEGDIVNALRLAEESLALRRAIAHGDGVADSLICVGELHWRAGDTECARAALEEAAMLAREQRRMPDSALALALLANLPGGDAAAAEAAFAEAGEALVGGDAARVRFLLWQATRSRAHLAEAKRHLDFLVEHAPPECREPMLTNVRLHREITEAAREAGL